MADGELRLLAAILDELCTRPVNRPRRYTNVELAGIICCRGGEITHTYISQLRKGDKDNPTCRTVEDLASALGVHPACFVGGRRELRPGDRPQWRRGALRRLFEAVHPPDRGPFSPEEVAAAIGCDGHYGSISASYIRELLAGATDNPRLKHILGLAHHFGVDPAYFFDEELASRVDEQLETRVAMDRLGVNAVILRATEQAPSQEVRNRILLALVRALSPGVAAERTISEVLEQGITNPAGIQAGIAESKVVDDAATDR
jgi:transcriptional regulator with XRE-family HTH domain